MESKQLQEWVSDQLFALLGEAALVLLSTLANAAATLPRWSHDFCSGALQAILRALSSAMWCLLRARLEGWMLWLLFYTLRQAQFPQPAFKGYQASAVPGISGIRKWSRPIWKEMAL